MEMERIIESSMDKSNTWEFANEIYIFCPGMNKGILFYDQSPKSITESIEKNEPHNGKFLSSGEKLVEWNEKINGHKSNIIPQEEGKATVVNIERLVSKKTEPYGGGIDSYAAVTIIVDTNTFLSILIQTNESYRRENENGHAIIDLNSTITKKEQNIYNNNEDDLLNLYNEYRKNKK